MKQKSGVRRNPSGDRALLRPGSAECNEFRNRDTDAVRQGVAMASNSVESGSSGAAKVVSARTVEPSIANALPYFVPLLIFPLVASAAALGA